MKKKGKKEEKTEASPASAKDEVLRACAALCKDDEETLSVLHAALAEVHERLAISEKKIGGGTSGEMWTAKHFGLEWEKEKMRGRDATDAEGKPCEIKASAHPTKKELAGKKTKVNVNYRTPSRKKGESDEDFVGRSRDKVLEADGGHYWATWKPSPDPTTGERVVLRWWVPSGPLSQLVEKKMRSSSLFENSKGSVPVNFGAVPCAKCLRVHKIDAVVKILGGWNGSDENLVDLEKKKRDAPSSIPEATICALATATDPSQC